MELAVLDLGSSTFHLQHFRVRPDGSFVTCLDVKKAISLGAQVFADGYVGPQSFAEAAAVLGELLKISDNQGFTQRTLVATSAIRTARNGRAVAQQIGAQHRCAVRVLEPDEEAALAYLGQLGSSDDGPTPRPRLATIDLGGGSVELCVGEQATPLYAASLPLGAVRLRAQAPGDHLDGSQLAALRALAREQLREPLRRMQRLQPERYLFGSGSARAVRKLLWRASALPGKTGPIATAELCRELAALEGHSPDALIALGVEPSRAQSVLVAAAIMLEILTLAGASHAAVSGCGLRDGVAREMLTALSRKRSGVFALDDVPMARAGRRPP